MSIPTSKICILIGAPGAGKGTISRFCVEQLNYKHISTGDLCRKHVDGKTEMGEKIDFLMKSGKLIDDMLVSKMVSDELTYFLHKQDNVILDGYPRTVRQAKLLDEYIKNSVFHVRVYILKLFVKFDTVLNRLSNRFICENKACQKVYSSCVNSGCVPHLANRCDDCGSALIRRNDDSYEAVQNRLVLYKNQEEELLGYFMAQGQEVVTIDVEQSIEKIFEIVEQKLSAF